jgi:hypothetical protein
MTTDGGNAFPQALATEEEYVGSEGMSLRDYFAGQSIAGQVVLDAEGAKRIAMQAYMLADAMLAERRPKA